MPTVLELQKKEIAERLSAFLALAHDESHVIYGDNDEFTLPPELWEEAMREFREGMVLLTCDAGPCSLMALGPSLRVLADVFYVAGRMAGEAGAPAEG